jgi:Glycosyl hydrolase family 53
MRHLFLSQSFLVFVALAIAAQAIPAAATHDAPTAENREVDFGVNGHPLVAGAYYDLSLERQISLLKTLKLRTYRVNVNPAQPEKFGRLSQLITLSAHEDIRILPVIVLPPKNYSNENEAYNDAKAKVYELAKHFDARISVWELGNEYDLYCVKKNADGDSPDDYDTEEYDVVRGLIKGMLAALHEASPSSRSIVQTSQHTPNSLDSGFLQRLIEDGITFDITGYHYYSTNGHVPTTNEGTNALKILHDKFHKPIWITEFDKSSSSRTVGPSSDPKAQGIALTAALNEIAAEAHKYDVREADIYELLDQPELLKNPNVRPCEAQFGILSSQGGLTDASTAVREFLRSYYRDSTR